MAYIVNIFTLDGCSHCVELKQALQDENIEYKEFEVNKHSNLYDKIVNITKEDAVPTVYLKDEVTQYGPIFVPGKDFTTKEELIGKIKKYLE